MGISSYLERLTEEQIEEFAKDPEALKKFLHMPYMEHLDYWQNEEARKEHDADRHDMDKSWEPLHYLLTLKTTDEACTGQKWRPPSKLTIRFENRKGKHNKFYTLFCEGYYVTPRYGTIGSINDTFDPTLGEKHPVWMVANQMSGQFGLAKPESFMSMKAYLEHIFSVIEEKIGSGYQIVYRNPLPPPVSPSVSTTKPPAAKGAKPRGRGVKRSAAEMTATTTTAEPARRSGRARKETPKQKEAREQKEERKRAKKEVNEEEKEEEEETEKLPSEAPAEAAAAGQEKREDNVDRMEEEKAAEEEKGKEKEKETGEVVPQTASIEFPWKLKVTELKAELEARGLPSDGKRDALVARLCMIFLGLELPGTTYVPPTVNPCSLLISGGQEIECEDAFSYGNPRALKPNQVKELCEAVEAKTEEELKARYDPKLMNDKAIGPPNFYGDESGTWDYLLLHFNSLKKFLRETTDRGLGLLIYLS